MNKMHERKVNQAQIEDLYAFTRKHFVEWYDLQTELVDHLANDIEAFWKLHPSLSYQEARDKAFKKFGVFGFMDVIEQRQNTMSRTYTKYLFSELRKWFEIPQILATATLFITFFVAFASPFSRYLLIMFYAMLAIWFIYKGIQLNRAFKRRRELSGKKWLLEEMIFKQAVAVGTVFSLQLFNVIYYSHSIFQNNKIIVIVSLVATLICLINYISMQILPKKAEKLLKATYPQFSM